MAKSSGVGEKFWKYPVYLQAWAIMAQSEMLSDNVALGKYEVHYTKKNNHPATLKFEFFLMLRYSIAE